MTAAVSTSTCSSSPPPAATPRRARSTSATHRRSGPALEIDAKNKAAAVSKVLSRLEDYELLRRDIRRRRAHVTLLREDGSGQPYARPTGQDDPYLQLTHAYWTGEWHKRLPLPAKAALLIARSFALQKDFYLPIESAPKQFGTSADTLGDGIRELRQAGVLDRRTEYLVDPLTALGYRVRYHYKLRPPFDQPAGANGQPAAAAPRPRRGARSVPQIFFRIVKGAEAAEDDFLSNFAKGRPPRRSEIADPVEHRSISVYARLEDALAVQRLYPKLGSHLAEFELADDDQEIVVTKRPVDPSDSHHNLQGEPAAFLRRVRRVFPAEQPG
jgi:DNA-binding Lrp family transcriptional regulator